MGKENFERISDLAVVRFAETVNHGVNSVMLRRIAINYILRGSKCIYCGDTCTQVDEGGIVIYDSGLHYEENIPVADGSFEQISFYATPELLQTVILAQHTFYGTDYTNSHSCESCRTGNFVTERADFALREFFTGIDRSFRNAAFRNDTINHRIKLGELLYLILSGEDRCLKAKILANTDADGERFTTVVHNNLFKDVSLESLAQMTNRSLTSFKKEFRRCFDASPHKWFVEQRLDRSRILLLSTNKTIAEVGAECAFTNISHFIKLFKQRFNATPAVFRQQQMAQSKSPAQAQKG